MKYVRAMLVAAAMLTGGSAWASAQTLLSVEYVDRDDRQAFNEGYRQGQWDARHGRRADWDDNRWREGDDRRAFRDGYLRGYREVEAAYRGEGFRDEGDYAHAVDSARHFGYQDGFSDGVIDRRSGHSFRPTHDDNYRHADRGYYRGLRDKSHYKQVYREGYAQGYQQGYDNGWRR